MFPIVRESNFRWYQRMIESYGGKVPRADYVAPPKRHKNKNPPALFSTMRRVVTEGRDYVRSRRGYLMRRDKLAA
jgi:hypothetical protein